MSRLNDVEPDSEAQLGEFFNERVFRRALFNAVGAAAFLGFVALIASGGQWRLPAVVASVAFVVVLVIYDVGGRIYYRLEYALALLQAIRDNSQKDTREIT